VDRFKRASAPPLLQAKDEAASLEGAKGEESEDEIEFVKDEEEKKGAESDEEEQREEEAWVAAQGGGGRRARMSVCGFRPTGWALTRNRKDGQGKTVYEPWVSGLRRKGDGQDGRERG
jgi:hypothetical protein